MESEPQKTTKRPRGRPKSSLRLRIAQEYYRLFYVEGYTRDRAIKRIRANITPPVCLNTIKNALNEYDDETSIGISRIERSPIGDIYLEYRRAGILRDEFELKGGVPYWFSVCLKKLTPLF